jgi:hypothetical protein
MDCSCSSPHPTGHLCQVRRTRDDAMRQDYAWQLGTKRSSDNEALSLESVSHLLGLGGLFEDPLLFGRQAVDAGVVDFLQDAVDFSL